MIWVVRCVSSGRSCCGSSLGYSAACALGSARCAAAFASCGSEVKNNTAQMLALVAGISQSVWSGASSASYLNKFQALGADIEKINKMLQEQVNDLTAMAEEYERAEQEAQTAASALKNNIVG